MRHSSSGSWPVLAFSLGLLIAGSAPAADVYFRPYLGKAVSGSFGGANSWTAVSGEGVGAPGPSDTAYISGFADQMDSTLNFDINATTGRLILSQKVLLNLNSKTYTVNGRTDLNTDANVTVAGGNFTTSILNFLALTPDATFNIRNDAQVRVVNNSLTSYSVLMEGTSHLNVAGSLVCTGVNFGIGVDTGFPHMTVSGPKASVAANSLLIAADSTDTDQISGSGDLAISNGGKLSVSSLLYVGLDGTGSLEVQSGSSLTAAVLSLGRSGSGTGTLLVDGAGSVLHATTNDAGALRVGRDGTGTLTIQNGATADTTSLELGYSGKAAGTVTVDGTGSSLSSSRSIAIGGSITAAGGTGKMTISHGGTAAAAAQVLIWKKGALNLDGGTLRADGGAVFAGAQIAGSGTIQAAVASTATTYQPGKMTITGDWSCTPGDTVQLRLHEDQDGGCDTLSAGGLVNLGGAKLDLGANPAPVTRQAFQSSYVLIENTGDQPISGTFAGIAEGDLIKLGPERFVASYQGGDGNDFTLTAIDRPPLELWKSLYFAAAVAADSDDQADPDHDGVSNFWERAYGLNPLNPDPDFAGPQVNLELVPPSPDSSSPPPSGDGDDDGGGEVIPTDPPAEPPPLEGFLTLTYRRSLAATDLTFAVKWSDDLTTWSSEGVVDTLVRSEGGVETRVAKVPVAPAGGGGRYLELQVTSPEPAAPN